MTAITHASLHHAIIRHFLERGTAPSHAALTEQFAVDAGAMTRALQELAAYHGVVLHPHAPEIWVAHPFSTAPTLFTVRHNARLWWETARGARSGSPGYSAAATW